MNYSLIQLLNDLCLHKIIYNFDISDISDKMTFINLNDYKIIIII